MSRLNSKEFSHKLFGSVTIIYDGNGNIYSIGDQLIERLGVPKDIIEKTVPEEFIIFLENVKKRYEEFIPKEYNKSGTIILKEPGIHILLASSPFARDFSIWLLSEVFPRIRGHSVFY